MTPSNSTSKRWTHLNNLFRNVRWFPDQPNYRITKCFWVLTISFWPMNRMTCTLNIPTVKKSVARLFQSLLILSTSYQPIFLKSSSPSAKNGADKSTTILCTLAKHLKHLLFWTDWRTSGQNTLSLNRLLSIGAGIFWNGLTFKK
jgi:hypothetical protein